MLTPSQIAEMAEKKYPLKPKENHGVSGNNEWEYLAKNSRNAYIAAFSDAMELMSKEWVPISEYIQEDGKRNKVMRWHKMWKCPISVFLGYDEYKGQWLECTLSTVWQEEAFEPFFMPLPEPPVLTKYKKI